MNSLATNQTNYIEIAQRQLSDSITRTIQDKTNSYRGIAMTFRKFSEGKDSLDSFKSFLLSEQYASKSKENVYNYFRSIANKNVKNEEAKKLVIESLKNTYIEATKETKKSKNRIEIEQETMHLGKDYLQEKDIEKVCSHLRATQIPFKNTNRDIQGNIKLALIIEFLFKTGCRVDELAQIRKEETILNGVAKIKLHGKGSKSRYTTISRNFYSEIEEVFQGKEYLFETKKHTKIIHQNLWKNLTDAFLLCGYGEKGKYKIHPHTLRHSFSMDKLEKGMDIKTLSELLGHSDIDITLRTYIHANPEKYKDMIIGREWNR